MSEKKPLPKPAWYKNTYFWIGGLLFILAVVGLPIIGGDNAIRDPGQKPESRLWLIYLTASAVMIINGLISHKQTVQQYEEETSGRDDSGHASASTIKQVYAEDGPAPKETK